MCLLYHITTFFVLFNEGCLDTFAVLPMMIGMLFVPYTILSLILIIFALILLFFLIQIGLVAKSFEKLKLSRKAIVLLLFSSLLGSFINIPIITLSSNNLIPQQTYFLSPFASYSEGNYTTIAINVGGALIPIIISAWLIIKHAAPVYKTIVSTLIVAFVMYNLAQPIKGVGISVPMLLTPLAAAIAAMIIAPYNSAAVAYVAGSMGVLIGADLLHINDTTLFGNTVLSIGGAGTFDGIFLTGIVAVLLA